jgi:hypothetical protein
MNRSMDWRSKILMPLMLLVSYLVMAAPAHAAEEGQPSYAEQVEPICRGFGMRLEGFTRYRPVYFTHDYIAPRAGVDLGKTGLALRETDKELKAVRRRPTEYQPQLEGWFRAITRAASYFERAGKALDADNKAEARNLLLDLDFPPEVQSVETALQFHYCRFELTKTAYFVLDYGD